MASLYSSPQLSPIDRPQQFLQHAQPPPIDSEQFFSFVKLLQELSQQSLTLSYAALGAACRDKHIFSARDGLKPLREEAVRKNLATVDLTTGLPRLVLIPDRIQQFLENPALAGLVPAAPEPLDETEFLRFVVFLQRAYVVQGCKQVPLTTLNSRCLKVIKTSELQRFYDTATRLKLASAAGPYFVLNSVEINKFINCYSGQVKDQALIPLHEDNPFHLNIFTALKGFPDIERTLYDECCPLAGRLASEHPALRMQILKQHGKIEDEKELSELLERYHLSGLVNLYLTDPREKSPFFDLADSLYKKYEAKFEILTPEQVFDLAQRLLKNDAALIKPYDLFQQLLLEGQILPDQPAESIDELFS